MLDIDSIVGATVSNNGEFIKPGKYKHKLLKAEFIQPRSGGTAFIAEFEVLESNNPRHQQGSKATFYQKMNDSAPGAIKAACLAFMGYSGDPNNLPPEVGQQVSAALQALGSNPQVFGPSLIECEAHMGELKKTPGREFCYITLKPWTMPEGWTAEPTPKEAVAPQTCLAVPAHQAAPVAPVPQAAPVYQSPPAAQVPTAPPSPTLQPPVPFPAPAVAGPPPGYGQAMPSPAGWIPPGQ